MPKTVSALALGGSEEGVTGKLKPPGGCPAKALGGVDGSSAPPLWPICVRLGVREMSEQVACACIPSAGTMHVSMLRRQGGRSLGSATNIQRVGHMSGRCLPMRICATAGGRFSSMPRAEHVGGSGRVPAVHSCAGGCSPCVDV